jgi:hypothetical protein
MINCIAGRLTSFLKMELLAPGEWGDIAVFVHTGHFIARVEFLAQ